MLSGALDNPVAAKADRGRRPRTHISARIRDIVRLMILFFKAFPPCMTKARLPSQSGLLVSDMLFIRDNVFAMHSQAVLPATT